MINEPLHLSKCLCIKFLIKLLEFIMLMDRLIELNIEIKKNKIYSSMISSIYNSILLLFVDLSFYRRGGWMLGPLVCMSMDAIM